jgi:tetratricopeptide repeat protein 8
MPAPDIDPTLLALSRYRRGRLDAAVDMCSELLSRDAENANAWFIKCRALTEKVFVDDAEDDPFEMDQGAELVDETALVNVARPGTSMPGGRGETAAGKARPASKRAPTSGFARPGTIHQRLVTASGRPASRSVGSRAGTSRGVPSVRPATGRDQVGTRTGFSSLVAGADEPFVDVYRINLQKFVEKATEAATKALFEYLLYVECNAVRALELAAEATQACGFKDWWWKQQVGKCQYRLGLFREAEKQLSSSLREQPDTTTYLWLAKTYLRMGQPNAAQAQFGKAAEQFPGEISALLGAARLWDALGEDAKSLQLYLVVQKWDSSNLEPLAMLAAHHFYHQQPELALRQYRRLLQMGVNSTELWTNLGLCTFYAQQYDIALPCFERALALAGDDNLPGVWYNIGHVAMRLGDLTLARYALKVCVSLDSEFAEAYCNLGVIEHQAGNLEKATSFYQAAHRENPVLVEALYNHAALLFSQGERIPAIELARKVLEIQPDHAEAAFIVKSTDA